MKVFRTKIKVPTKITTRLHNGRIHVIYPPSYLYPPNIFYTHNLKPVKLSYPHLYTIMKPLKIQKKMTNPKNNLSMVLTPNAIYGHVNKKRHIPSQLHSYSMLKGQTNIFLNSMPKANSTKNI